MKVTRLGMPALILLLFAHLATDSKAQTPPPEYVEINQCEDGLKLDVPDVTCTIVVPDESRLTAYSIGSKDCRFDSRLDRDNPSLVFRYELEDPDKYSFSGAREACPDNSLVAEAPQCDFTNDPFFGLQCMEISPDGRSDCPSCVDLKGTRGVPAACWVEVPGTNNFDILLNNVNFCDPGTVIELFYLIAVKANEVTELNGQKYRRIFIVDPTVVQEPIVPPPPPPPVLYSKSPSDG